MFHTLRNENGGRIARLQSCNTAPIFNTILKMYETKQLIKYNF